MNDKLWEQYEEVPADEITAGADKDRETKMNYDLWNQFEIVEEIGNNEQALENVNELSYDDPYVYNNSSENLGDVEAGAQVNIIETINVNGEALSIVNKAVDITIDSQSEYTVAKSETAEDGYVSTYILTKDGTQVGEKINIPKDLVVESGSVETCTTADSPVEGYAIGDRYIYHSASVVLPYSVVNVLYRELQAAYNFYARF